MQLPIVTIETSTITTFLSCFLQRTIVTLLLIASEKNVLKFKVVTQKQLSRLNDLKNLKNLNDLNMNLC